MKYFPALVLASLISLVVFTQKTTAAQSAPTPGETMMLYGSSQVSCQEWAAASPEFTQRIYLQWVLGFLTGATVVLQPAPLAPTNNEQITAYVTAYCADRPSATLTEVASWLVVILKWKAALVTKESKP